MHRHPPRRHERGLTSVGVGVLLVGMGIIAILVLAEQNTFVHSKLKATQLKIGNVKSAVNTFYATVGHHPTQGEGFLPLLHPPDDLRPMLEALPQDEWGNLLLYFSPPVSGDAPFEIRSAGADGVWFTDDDLSSIKRDR